MARSLNFKRLIELLFEETSDFSSERRHFLTTAALGSAASLALAGCGSFDRWVLGDNERLNQEVMILGGGLAGLAAAYHLKRNKTPYRLFEASSRLGGRVQTIQHFNADQQFAELGAEFFDGNHHFVHQLCKDLSLDVQEISYKPKTDRALYWIQGKVMSEKEFKKRLRPVALKLAEARRAVFAGQAAAVTRQTVAVFSGAKNADRQSLADLLSSIRSVTSAEVMECFEKLCISEWGVETKEINLLQFLVRLDFEERAISAGPGRIYRAEGGMSRMINILGERVQGVVPDSTLKLQHQLVAIREKAGGFECTFKTPKKSDVIWARQVICTLPWSLLKDVDGVQSLGIEPAAKELIANATYASHSKVVGSFKDPFWRKNNKSLPAFQGIFRGQLVGQVYWDSSRGQEGSHAILTSQRGGQKGQATGADAVAETYQDLQHFQSEPPKAESSQIMNWSQKPFSKGSRFNLGPGRYLRFLEFLNQEKVEDTFYFAGEHMSFRDFGTMNGAIETAIHAANKAMQKNFADLL